MDDKTKMNSKTVCVKVAPKQSLILELINAGEVDPDLQMDLPNPSWTESDPIGSTMLEVKQSLDNVREKYGNCDLRVDIGQATPQQISILTLLQHMFGYSI